MMPDDAELAALARAYGSEPITAEERDRDHQPVYIVPTTWTEAHVQHRLVEAFTVLARHGSAPGPKTLAAAWPTVLNQAVDLVDEDVRHRVLTRAFVSGQRPPEGKEWEPYVDGMTRRQMQGDAAEAKMNQKDAPTSPEIDMADEALHWAVRYLDNEPAEADALQLWAWAKANNRKIEKLLRRRALAADALIARRSAEREDLRRVRRLEIAREVLAWGNPRIVSAASREESDAIRAEMQRRASYQIAYERLDQPAPKIPRSEVAPGRVMTRTYLDLCRKEGARRVSRGLRRDGVIVR